MTKRQLPIQIHAPMQTLEYVMDFKYHQYLRVQICRGLHNDLIYRNSKFAAMSTNIIGGDKDDFNKNL